MDISISGVLGMAVTFAAGVIAFAAKKPLAYMQIAPAVQRWLLTALFTTLGIVAGAGWATVFPDRPFALPFTLVGVTFALLIVAERSYFLAQAIDRPERPLGNGQRQPGED